MQIENKGSSSSFLYFTTQTNNKNIKMTTLYDFTVKDIKNNDWNLADLKGKVIIYSHNLAI